MSPHEASSIRGKVFFALSATFAMVGRAATLPLVTRQYRDTDHSFLPGSEAWHTYLFFQALLPNLPDLFMPIIPDPTPPLLIYTDASFWLAKKRSRLDSDVCSPQHHSCLRGALGVLIYDPLDHSARYASAEPPWALLLASWRTDRKTYIAELETLAAISAYSTYPSLIAGRKVNHFIDNTVALSALVHGYSGKPDLAKAVNVFYLQMLSLRASVFFDYVPSKANIADLPSRNMFVALDHELLGITVRGSAPNTLVVPSVARWHAPLASWVQASRHSTTTMPL